MTTKYPTRIPTAAVTAPSSLATAITISPSSVSPDRREAIGSN